MAVQQNTISRFHNLPDAALADELGRVDAISKAAEAELKALKWGAQGRVQGPWALLRHWRRLRGYGDGTDRRAARRQGGARVPGRCLFAFRGRRRLDRDPDQGGQPRAADRGLTFPFNPAPLASSGGVQYFKEQLDAQRHRAGKRPNLARRAYDR